MRKRKVPFEVLMNSMTGYYKDVRGKYRNIFGRAYFCDDCDVETLNKYHNVVIGESYCEYAPEIHHRVIFVGDKCF